EFALVLTEASSDAATAVSRRICERLAQDGEFPYVTVSVGAAVFPRDGETIDALFNAADRALYLMKGRSDGIHTLARIAACLEVDSGAGSGLTLNNLSETWSLRSTGPQ